jgi:hypothetical protein
MEPAPLPPPTAGALPQPPPTVADPVPFTSRRPPERGELITGWRIVFAAAWVGIVVGLMAVWWASRKLGLSTWWLGPASEPRLFLVTIVPFVAPVVVVTAVLRRVPFAPLFGLVAGATTVAVGAADLGRVAGLAAIELSLGTAGILVSVAALTGMYR